MDYHRHSIWPQSSVNDGSLLLAGVRPLLPINGNGDQQVIQMMDLVAVHCTSVWRKLRRPETNTQQYYIQTHTCHIRGTHIFYPEFVTTESSCCVCRHVDSS